MQFLIQHTSRRIQYMQEVMEISHLFPGNNDSAFPDIQIFCFSLSQNYSSLIKAPMAENLLCSSCATHFFVYIHLDFLTFIVWLITVSTTPTVFGPYVHSWSLGQSQLISLLLILIN